MTGDKITVSWGRAGKLWHGTIVAAPPQHGSTGCKRKQQMSAENASGEEAAPTTKRPSKLDRANASTTTKKQSKNASTTKKRQSKLDGANANTKKATTRRRTKLDGPRFLENLARGMFLNSICSAAYVCVYALYNVYMYLYKCSTCSTICLYLYVARRKSVPLWLLGLLSAYS